MAARADAVQVRTGNLTATLGERRELQTFGCVGYFMLRKALDDYGAVVVLEFEGLR